MTEKCRPVSFAEIDAEDEKAWRERHPPKPLTKEQADAKRLLQEQGWDTYV